MEKKVLFLSLETNWGTIQVYRDGIFLTLAAWPIASRVELTQPATIEIIAVPVDGSRYGFVRWDEAWDSETRSSTQNPRTLYIQDSFPGEFHSLAVFGEIAPQPEPQPAPQPEPQPAPQPEPSPNIPGPTPPEISGGGGNPPPLPVPGGGGQGPEPIPEPENPGTEDGGGSGLQEGGFWGGLGNALSPVTTGMSSMASGLAGLVSGLSPLISALPKLIPDFLSFLKYILSLKWIEDLISRFFSSLDAWLSGKLGIDPGKPFLEELAKRWVKFVLAALDELADQDMQKRQGGK